jgi:deoxyribodipyrimidine photo-lyase
VSWRELGFNFCAHRSDADRFESLPAWALRTMAEHARDPRPRLYDLDALQEARTADPLWNASQRQLLREGRIHDRWALDGRDPGSYSGIAWVLGRYDRAWGPERPIFGKLRLMTSSSTARKLRLRELMARYGDEPPAKLRRVSDPPRLDKLLKVCTG